ncbi:MAG: tetratricopeptide repeat protein [Bacteroidales bacterium]
MNITFSYFSRISRLTLILISALLVFVSCKTHKPAVKNQVKGEIVVLDNKTRAIHELFIDGQKQKVLGNYDKAIEILNRCLNLDQENAACMYELANIYERKGRIGDALNMAKKAAETDPTNIWYLYLYAQLLESTQQFKEAGEVYKKLASLETTNSGFLEDLAQVYILQGKYGDALKVYEQIEARYGMDEVITMQKQKIYLATGKIDKAIDEINNLISLNPLETRYYALLAETYMTAGKPDKALEAYNKILSMNPDDPFIHISLADYYRKIGDKEKFTEELRLAFANSNLDIDTKIEILLSFFGLTEVLPELKPQAYQLIDELIKIHPDDPKAHSIYGDFLYRDQKLLEARNAFRHVLSLDSSRYAVWEQLIRIEAELEDYPSTAAVSKRAMDLFPEQPLPMLFRGMALYQMKQYSECIDPLKRGVFMIVDNDELEETFHSMLGDAYHQVKEYTKSDESYEKALKIKPDNPYVLNNYSYYLSLRGEKLDKAEQMAKKANELVPDNSSYLDTYGWVLYKLNRLSEAEQYILKSLEKGGNKSAEVLEHYGDVLYRKGEKDRALEYWQKAKDAGKNSELLEKKLKEKTLYE